MKATQSKPGFHTLDILGSKFNFSFNSVTGKFQTSLGGYITILMTIFSLGAFTLIASQLFDTNSPIVTTSNEFASKVVNYQLYDEEIIIPILLEAGGQFLTHQIDRYATIRLEVNTFAQNKETQQLELGIAAVYEYVPCTTIKDQHVLDVLYKMISSPDFVNFNLCPDFKGTQKEYAVSQDLIETSFRKLTFSFLPCSLENQAQCASEEELRLASITFPRIDKYLDPSNKGDPLRAHPFVENIRLDARNTKFRQYYLIKHKIVDDDSLFSGPRERLTYASAELASMDTSSRDPNQLHCSKQSIALGFRSPCRELFKFEFLASSQLRITRRNYKKLTQIFGEFGGVLKIATTVMIFFYSFYSGRKMNSFILDSIFGMKTKKDQYRVNEMIERHKMSLSRAANSSNTNANKKGFTRQWKAREIMGQYVSSSCDVLDVLGKLEFVGLLQNVILTDSQKKLLPLTLLKLQMDQEAKNQAQSAERSSNGSDSPQNSPNSDNELFSKKSNQGSKTKLRRDRLSQIHPQKVRDEKPTYHSLFEELRNTTPETEVEKKINKFMVKNLNKFFSEPENKVEIFSPINQLPSGLGEGFSSLNDNSSRQVPTLNRERGDDDESEESKSQLSVASPDTSLLNDRHKIRLKGRASKFSIFRRGSLNRSSKRIKPEIKFDSAERFKNKKSSLKRISREGDSPKE